LIATRMVSSREFITLLGGAAARRRGRSRRVRTGGDAGRRVFE
jgi:hypothetical protein